MTTKRFTFEFPLKHKVVKDLKIVTEHKGVLNVEAVGCFNPAYSLLDIFDRYSVDLEFVYYNGTDIKDVLEVFGILDDIEEQAVWVFSEISTK